MRRAALIGTLITFAVFVFGLMQVASVGANTANLPALQATATTDADSTATADADTTATTGTTATTDADTTATTGTTATTDTTATVGADTTATAGADTTATAATTATADSTATADTTATITSQGQLPDTGGSNSPTLTLLVIGTVLVVFGAFAVVSLVATRRNT